MPGSDRCDVWNDRPNYHKWSSETRVPWQCWSDPINRALEEMWEMPILGTEVAVLEVERPLEERFLEHAEKWQHETEHLSSPTQMMMHPTYQAILGLAREHESAVIRLMLEDLRDNRRMWFWALAYLTKENPIKAEDSGKLDKMIKAWVDWGKQRGRL
jgi:hypothetical protein